MTWDGLLAHDRIKRELQFSGEAVGTVTVQTGRMSFHDERGRCVGAD